MTKVKVKSLSHARLFAIPRTVAFQAPPSVEFSRQEYWSGLPFPSPEGLPDPRIEPGCPALQAYALPSEPPGIAQIDKRQLIRASQLTSQRCCLGVSELWQGVVLYIRTFRDDGKVLRLYCPKLQPPATCGTEQLKCG